MTLEQMSERLNTVREIITNTQPLSVSFDSSEVRVQLTLDDLRRLFAGCECTIRRYADVNYYSVEMKGCVFTANGRIPAPEASMVTL